jgi:hypothetical protein
VGAGGPAAAGLDFVIVTDHGDGTKPVGPPAYRSGVLCIEAVELSAAQGHYAALGLPPAPYPLRGASEDVVEDVARLGGFGLVTHPESPRRELSWHAWDTPFDGLEWVNADSEWRDERWPQLAGTLLRYPWRPTESIASLIDDAGRTLSRWDRLTAIRRVVALAGVDAHGGFAVERESGTQGEYKAKPLLRVPTYRALLRLLDNLVLLSRRPSGDAAADARDLINAIRLGRVSSAVAGFAAPAALWLSVRSGGLRAWMGETIWPNAALVVEVGTNAPAGSRILVKRNGRIILTGTSPALVGEIPAERGAVRAEVWLSGAGSPAVTPWAVANPVYVAYPPEAPVPAVRWAHDQPAGAGVALAAPPESWQVERDTTSRAVWTPSEKTADIVGALDVVLGRGDGSRGPYGALALGLPPGTITSEDSIEFEARADRPCRLSLQLRAGDSTADRRWRRSLYLDGTTRTYRVPVRTLQSVSDEQLPPRPADLARADSLLFVLDSVNLNPGDGRIVSVSRPRRVPIDR